MENTNNWVLMEEGYPVAINLSHEQALEMKDQYNKIADGTLVYTIFYDAYYEFTDIHHNDE